MSYLEVIRGGKIPTAKPKTKRALTPYDRFIAGKQVLLKEELPLGIKIITPKTFADVKNLLDILKGHSGLVVDFEGLAAQDAQRLLDYMSGAVYVLDGRVERIKETAFLFTPKGIDIKCKD